MLAAPVLHDPIAADDQDAYVATLRADLRTLWCNVIRRRAPQGFGGDDARRAIAENDVFHRLPLRQEKKSGAAQCATPPVIH